eukprot:m.39674 g.39674  ORF g.39674 m.39674 type:complete len:1084 (-) comp5956_c0_seq2:1112-4363(-)
MAEWGEGDEAAHAAAEALLDDSGDIDNSGDMDAGSDSDDDGTVYCYCRQPDDGREMVECERCKDWFHDGCVVIPEGSFICPGCGGPPAPAQKSKRKSSSAQGGRKQKRRRAGSDDDNSESDGDGDDDDASSRKRHARNELDQSLITTSKRQRKPPRLREGFAYSREFLEMNSVEQEEDDDDQTAVSKTPTTKEKPATTDKAKSKPKSKTKPKPKSTSVKKDPLCSTPGCKNAPLPNESHCSKCAEAEAQKLFESLRGGSGSAATGVDVDAATPKSSPSQASASKRRSSSSFSRRDSAKSSDSPAPPVVKRSAVALDPVRAKIRHTLADILATRAKTDGITLDNAADMAAKMEQSMYEKLEDADYKAKYRAVSFNLKSSKNTYFFPSLAEGKISPEQIADMAPADMANPEDAKEREEERLKSLKQQVLLPEQMKMVIGNTKYVDRIEDIVKNVEKQHLTAEAEIGPIKHAESEEPPAENESGERDSESATPAGSPDAATPAQVLDGADTLSRVIRTETAAQEKALRHISGTSNATSAASSPGTAMSETATTSPASKTASAPQRFTGTAAAKAPARRLSAGSVEAVVWKGAITMSGLTTATVAARRAFGISGSTFHELLRDTVELHGRIKHADVWAYISQLKYSTSREIFVMAFEPQNADDEPAFISMFEYFHSRERCGVVGKTHHSIKDMYVVPLSQSEAIPPALADCGLDGPGIEKQRTRDMLLGVVVRGVEHHKKRSSSSHKAFDPLSIPAVDERGSSSRGSSSHRSSGARSHRHQHRQHPSKSPSQPSSNHASPALEDYSPLTAYSPEQAYSPDDAYDPVTAYSPTSAFSPGTGATPELDILGGLSNPTGMPICGGAASTSRCAAAQGADCAMPPASQEQPMPPHSMPPHGHPQQQGPPMGPGPNQHPRDGSMGPGPAGPAGPGHFPGQPHPGAYYEQGPPPPFHHQGPGGPPGGGGRPVGPPMGYSNYGPPPQGHEPMYGGGPMQGGPHFGGGGGPGGPGGPGGGPHYGGGGGPPPHFGGGGGPPPHYGRGGPGPYGPPGGPPGGPPPHGPGSYQRDGPGQYNRGGPPGRYFRGDRRGYH